MLLACPINLFSNQDMERQTNETTVFGSHSERGLLPAPCADCQPGHAEDEEEDWNPHWSLLCHEPQPHH